MHTPDSPSIFSQTNHEVFLISAVNNGKRSAFIATWCLPCEFTSKYAKIDVLGSPLTTQWSS